MALYEGYIIVSIGIITANRSEGTIKIPTVMAAITQKAYIASLRLYRHLRLELATLLKAT